MRLVVVGEGMVELRRAGPVWQLGHGGDTLNMAIHLARFGRDVAYFTALGRDRFSHDLQRAWTEEGIDPSLILRDPSRTPGLYAITIDDGGERSFAYWRSDSAARGLFGLPGIAGAIHRAAQADLLCLSLISLAVLPPSGRNALLELCRRVRGRGGRVAFDGNYRAALWAHPDEARSARDAAIACCDFGLPSLDDEMELGAPFDPMQLSAEWKRLGAGEVVVKLGADGCFTDGETIAPPVGLQPIDTSGAGDAFGAGYLQARLAGSTPKAAAALGQRLAQWVVMRPGAIPAVDDDCPYGGARLTSKESSMSESMQ